MPVISKAIKAGKMTKNKLKHKIYLSKSVLNLCFKHVKSYVYQTLHRHFECQCRLH